MKEIKELTKDYIKMAGTLAKMAKLIGQMKSKLDALENLVVKSIEVGVKQTRNEVIDEASFDALHSMVIELTEREGISQEEAQKHFERRFQYFHQVHLQITEDTSPNLSAEIDTRETVDPDAVESYPPLFGAGG